MPAAEERVARPFIDYLAVSGVGAPFGLDLPVCFHAVAVKLQVRAFAPGQREQGGEEKRITPLAQDQIRVGPLDEPIKCGDDASAGERKNARLAIPLDNEAAFG